MGRSGDSKNTPEEEQVITDMISEHALAKRSLLQRKQTIDKLVGTKEFSHQHLLSLREATKDYVALDLELAMNKEGWADSEQGASLPTVAGFSAADYKDLETWVTSISHTSFESSAYAATVLREVDKGRIETARGTELREDELQKIFNKYSNIVDSLLEFSTERDHLYTTQETRASLQQVATTLEELALVSLEHKTSQNFADLHFRFIRTYNQLLTSRLVTKEYQQLLNRIDEDEEVMENSETPLTRRAGIADNYKNLTLSLVKRSGVRQAAYVTNPQRTWEELQQAHDALNRITTAAAFSNTELFAYMTNILEVFQEVLPEALLPQTYESIGYKLQDINEDLELITRQSTYHWLDQGIQTFSEQNQELEPSIKEVQEKTEALVENYEELVTMLQQGADISRRLPSSQQERLAQETTKLAVALDTLTSRAAVEGSMYFCRLVNAQNSLAATYGQIIEEGQRPKEYLELHVSNLAAAMNDVIENHEVAVQKLIGLAFNYVDGFNTLQKSGFARKTGELEQVAWFGEAIRDGILEYHREQEKPVDEKDIPYDASLRQLHLDQKDNLYEWSCRFSTFYALQIKEIREARKSGKFQDDIHKDSPLQVLISMSNQLYGHAEVLAEDGDKAWKVPYEAHQKFVKKHGSLIGVSDDPHDALEKIYDAAIEAKELQTV